MTDPAAALPVGTIIATMVRGETPIGWLVCDGSPVPPQYPQLAALCGGATPNLIGRTLIGAGNLAAASVQQTDGRAPNFVALANAPGLNVADTGGEAVHVLTSTEMPPHYHTIAGNNFGTHGRSFEGESGSDLPFETNPDDPMRGTDLAGGNAQQGTDPHFNVQPYFAVTYLIFAG